MHHLRIANPVGPVQARLRGGAQQVVEFRRSLYLRMAGQYLLQQGRAGAGQAQDQNRRVVAVSPAFALSEEILIEHFDNAVVAVLEGDGIVIDLEALFTVAVVVVVEGPAVVFAVFVGLAQREGKRDLGILLFLIGRVAQFFQLAFHLGDVRVLKPERLEVGQAPIGFAKIRFGLGTTPVRLDGVCLFAHGFERVSHAQ